VTRPRASLLPRTSPTNSHKEASHHHSPSINAPPSRVLECHPLTVHEMRRRHSLLSSTSPTNSHKQICPPSLSIYQHTSSTSPNKSSRGISPSISLHQHLTLTRPLPTPHPHSPPFSTTLSFRTRHDRARHCR